MTTTKMLCKACIYLRKSECLIGKLFGVNKFCQGKWFYQFFEPKKTI